MEIRNLMQKMHNAATEKEKWHIIREIDARFPTLSDLEKMQVQKDFLESLDEKFKEVDKLIKKVDILSVGNKRPLSMLQPVNPNMVSKPC